MAGLPLIKTPSEKPVEKAPEKSQKRK